MASKSTTSKTTTEEEEKKKELIARIAKKIKTDKNLSNALAIGGPEQLQINLSDAIKGAVKALDDDESGTHTVRLLQVRCLNSYQFLSF